jgi:endonuclease/exonuclease/phosphatase family metal-dependent hydrolase
MFILAGGYQAAPISRTLRVLTYNIHHGEGTDGIIDLSRQAEIVKSVQPDLVALQEVDERTERTSGVNQLQELARLTGMHAEFGKAMDYSGGGYGVAVLSRWPIVGTRNNPLPTFQDREPRTALTALVRVDAAWPLLQFTSTHLDQGRDEGNRLAQVEHLNALEVGDEAPEILAGDMNSRPDTEVMKLLERQWTNATTADPSMPLAADGRPRFRGDYILVRPTHCWRVIEATVLDDRLASDHRPVLVVLEWIATCATVEQH